jgi:hypothetical protein
MGFLTELFGSSKKRSLHDSDLGEFTELTHNGAVINWEGQIKFLNETISLFITGNADQLNSAEKASLLDILQNETAIEAHINEALLQQYEEANKKYVNWQTHFNCITISSMNNEISITFEEKDSLYHFNIFLLNSKVVGVSIDS